MATNKGISEDKFNDIKIVVSRWYDRRHFVSMLKVVYKDHLENNILYNDETTIDILNSLYAAGHLNSTDLTLLYDTIKLTKQFGLEKKIEDKLPSIPNIKEGVISRFSDHRQRIVKFGHALIDAHIQAIDGIYNNPKINYGDGWSMISDLENRLIICKGKPMDKFIKKLKTLELDNIIRILKGVTPSRKRKTQQALHDVREQPKPKRKRSRMPNKKSSKLVISEDDYPLLLDAVSRWWHERGNINMLKFLLRQFRPNISQLDIQKTNNVTDLFKLLEAKGELNKSKLNVMFEAVKLCGLDGVEDEIQDIMPSFQGFKEVDIKTFSPYRQKLIKFGSSLNMESIKRIGQVTGINKKEQQEDQWVLICALEDKGTIKEDSLTDFITLLERLKMNQVADLLQ